MKRTECDYCGNELTDEEIEYPATDGYGNEIQPPVCEECFREHYEFTCSRCQNYENIEFQHVWLVVFEPVDSRPDRGEIRPGIYEIVDFPYYGGSLLGGNWLYTSSLRRIRTKIDFRRGGYPVCHLCRDCAKKLHLRESKKGKEFRKSQRVT